MKACTPGQSGVVCGDNFRSLRVFYAGDAMEGIKLTAETRLGLIQIEFSREAQSPSLSAIVPMSVDDAALATPCPARPGDFARILLAGDGAPPRREPATSRRTWPARPCAGTCCTAWSRSIPIPRVWTSAPGDRPGTGRAYGTVAGRLLGRAPGVGDGPDEPVLLELPGRSGSSKPIRPSSEPEDATRARTRRDDG